MYCTDSVYVKNVNGRVLVLVVYVDDLVLIGPRSQMAAEWSAIRKELKTSVPERVERILGNYLSVNKTKSGKRKVLWEQSAYAKDLIGKFKAAAGIALTPPLF